MRPQQSTLQNNVDSDLAVQAYIESLLFESDIAVNSADANTAQHAKPAPDDTLAASDQVDAAGDLALDAIDLDAEEATLDVAQNNPFLKQLEAAQRRGRSQVAAATAAVKVDNRPAWGRENFRCLAFNVSGLKLAVPVQFIDGMQPLDLLTSPASAAESALNTDSITQEDSIVQGPLALGQMKLDRGESESKAGLMLCTVLDTARLVMPERYDNAMKASYRYVLTLKGCDWSIAVDSIGGEIGLSPQNVRWRSEHTRREWLAGTVVDKMCALIDIDLLNRQLMADAILMDGK